MSLFRLVKYSSLLYFLGKHRGKLFRSIAILLFAFVTSLLYEDLRVYLESQHPESLAYALIAKVVIVYGSLAFVLFQFRPRKNGDKQGEARAAAMPRAQKQDKPEAPADRLSRLEDVDGHRDLRSRYDRVLMGEPRKPGRATGKADKS
ncbi:MAG: hypothetical protein AAFY29_17385 [Pseudomonadota bacterium]